MVCIMYNVICNVYHSFPAFSKSRYILILPIIGVCLYKLGFIGNLQVILQRKVWTKSNDNLHYWRNMICISTLYTCEQGLTRLSALEPQPSILSFFIINYSSYLAKNCSNSVIWGLQFSLENSEQVLYLCTLLLHDTECCCWITPF